MADWIHGMLKCEFFTTCPRHRDQKKAEVSSLAAPRPQLPLLGNLLVTRLARATPSTV